jgi:hypothetical protein
VHILKIISKRRYFILLVSPAILVCLYLYTSAQYNGITSDIVLYISPNGSDFNDGTENSPLKTLEGFKSIITKLNNENRLLKIRNIKVFLREGSYYRDKTLLLDKRDLFDNNILSNINISIEFKGYKKEKVILTGATILSANRFEKITDESVLSSFVNKEVSKNILKYDLKKDGIYFGNIDEAIENYPELFFNNSPMQLSRWPNNKFAKIDNVINNSQEGEGKGFVFQIYDNHMKTWNNLNDIWMFGYWNYDWYDSIVKVRTITQENNTVESENNIPFGIKNNQRFYFFNILQEIDIPGEYYIDRTNGILYFYPPGPINESYIQLSQLKDTFITINDMSNITFENIIFDGSRGGGVVVSNSNNVKFNDCIFRNLSQNGITIHGGENNGIESCTIFNTGTGGIILNGGDRNTLTGSGHYAYNNHIYNYSRIKKAYSPAIEINGVGNKIYNNLIHDGEHTAIIFRGNDNVIEYNEIYNVATQTDDVGAIYSGRDWTYRGNIIRYNFLHDINNDIGRYGKAGIYLDDCMSSAEVYGNVFYKVDLPLFIGGGRDLVIENNIIINCSKSIWFDERGITWYKLDDLYSNLRKAPYFNEIWQEKYPEVLKMVEEVNPGVPRDNVIQNNILYLTSEETIAPSVLKYGIVKNNILYNENPGFKDIDKMNFSLEENSEVFKAIKDFKNISLEKVGLKKEP